MLLKLFVKMLQLPLRCRSSKVETLPTNFNRCWRICRYHEMKPACAVLQVSNKGLTMVSGWGLITCTADMPYLSSWYFSIVRSLAIYKSRVCWLASPNWRSGHTMLVLLIAVPNYPDMLLGVPLLEFSKELLKIPSKNLYCSNPFNEIYIQIKLLSSTTCHININKCF